MFIPASCLEELRKTRQKSLPIPFLLNDLEIIWGILFSFFHGSQQNQPISKANCSKFFLWKLRKSVHLSIIDFFHKSLSFEIFFFFNLLIFVRCEWEFAKPHHFLLFLPTFPFWRIISVINLHCQHQILERKMRLSELITIKLIRKRVWSHEEALLNVGKASGRWWVWSVVIFLIKLSNPTFWLSLVSWRIKFKLIWSHFVPKTSIFNHFNKRKFLFSLSFN